MTYNFLTHLYGSSAKMFTISVYPVFVNTARGIHYEYYIKRKKQRFDDFFFHCDEHQTSAPYVYTATFVANGPIGGNNNIICVCGE